MMINPNHLETWRHRHTDRARGSKSYRVGFAMPGVSMISRRKFRTATEAVEYGDRVIARWKRLYAVAILQLAASAPTQVEP